MEQNDPSESTLSTTATLNHPHMMDYSDTDSESSHDIINVWVWIHVPTIEDIEHMYWDALIRIRRGEYTVYYQDPKTIDSKNRALVLELAIAQHVDIKNWPQKLELQLRADIESVLDIFEAHRLSHGIFPFVDSGGEDSMESEWSETVTETADETEDESEFESMAQLRPRLISPVPYDSDSDDDTVVASDSDSATLVDSEISDASFIESESSDITVWCESDGDTVAESDGTVFESDSDDDSSVEFEMQPPRKKARISPSDLDSESEIDTDDILGVESSEEESEGGRSPGHPRNVTPVSIEMRQG